MSGQTPAFLGAWALALLLAGLAAGEAAPAKAGGEPGLIGALRAKGAEILALGTQGGLDGYFVTPVRGAGYGLYVTQGGHAVAGLPYGPDGTEITGAQLAAARSGDASPEDAASAPQGPGTETVTAHAAPDAAGAPSRAMFERSAAAFGFTLGERGPLVLLFADPACRWSRAAAARLGREALAGGLRLRVIPVAVLGADSARRAAGIVAHADPALAWFEGGGIRPDRQGARRIARNNALFEEWGADAVPLIAWQARGGAVEYRIGDVDDARTWLRDTLRLGDPRAGGTRARDPRVGGGRE